MTDVIRVVIADDHRLMLDGLSQALDSLPDISVVGTVVDGADLAGEVASKNPDVLLVDVEMPRMSGLAAISKMEDLPPTLIVTMHAADEYGASAREAGARGFLSKGLPLPELAASIRAANAGLDLFDATADDIAAFSSPTLSSRAETITDREKDVLRCLVAGISGTEDIADELYISQKTVKNHLASIYLKLGVNDRTQAAVEAMKLGLDRDWA